MTSTSICALTLIRFFGADLTLSSDVTADVTKQVAHVTKFNAQLKDDSLRLTKPLLVTWGARTGRTIFSQPLKTRYCAGIPDRTRIHLTKTLRSDGAEKPPARFCVTFCAFTRY